MDSTKARGVDQPAILFMGSIRPLMPEPEFQAYEAGGDPGATPFTLFIRKTDAAMVVARAEVGLTKDPEVFIREMQDSLKADWNPLGKRQKDPFLQRARAQKNFFSPARRIRYTDSNGSGQGTGGPPGLQIQCAV